MNISIKNPIERLGLPLIVTSRKPNLCFLIDTGATHNILFSYVYEEFSELFSSERQTCYIMGIDGNSHQVSQVEATFKFEDKESIAAYSILDATEAVMQVHNECGIQIHGILGIPFLTQNKWVLDFNKLTLYC